MPVSRREAGEGRKKDGGEEKAKKGLGLPGWDVH